MDRQTREELKSLSLEFLGTTSKWRKIVEKGTNVEKVNPTTGKKFIQTVPVTAEELLESLRKLKAEQAQSEAIAEVQAEAGTVGEL
jgi:hypothetical protein